MSGAANSSQEKESTQAESQQEEAPCEHSKAGTGPAFTKQASIGRQRYDILDPHLAEHRPHSDLRGKPNAQPDDSRIHSVLPTR